MGLLGLHQCRVPPTETREFATHTILVLNGPFVDVRSRRNHSLGSDVPRVKSIEAK